MPKTEGKQRKGRRKLTLRIRMPALESKSKSLVNKRVKNQSTELGFIKEQCSAIALL